MKHVLTLLLLLALPLSGFALAEYDPDDDVTVRIDNPLVQKVAKKTKLGRLGTALFDAQEGAHDTFTEITGAEIDHYYFHLCSGDECVSVGPMRLSN